MKLLLQMVGGKAGLQILLKSKVSKVVKPKKSAHGVQKTIDSYHGHVVNSDTHMVDYEAPVNTTGTQWVNVDSDSDGFCSSQGVSQSQPAQQQHQQPAQNSTRSWADVASPQVSNPSTTGLGGSESVSMQHKTDIPLVFLSYARVHTAGEHLPLVQIAEAVMPWDMMECWMLSSQ